MVFMDIRVDLLHVEQAVIRDIEKVVHQEHQRNHDADTEDHLNDIPGPENPVGVVTELKHVEQEPRGSQPVKDDDGEVVELQPVQVLSGDRDLEVG